MSIVSKPTIIIAAVASRPYVKAAVAAGFEVVAIDCFSDVDTRRLAQKVYKVPMRHGSLDCERVLAVLKEVETQGVLGLCYGAGFEMQPLCLDRLQQVIHVLGNLGDVVTRCKEPRRFFQLCDSLDVTHPAVMLNLPKQKRGWIQKTTGGSGGTHIRPVAHCENVEETVYYQKQQKGKSIACLFLASKQGVEILGFHEQWVDGTVAEPYRYGGAATNIKVSDLVANRFRSFIASIAHAVGLVGINSCDAVCDGDDVAVLEINPRLSATVDLYVSAYPKLIDWHVKASSGLLLEEGLAGHALGGSSHAHQIVYAKDDLMVAVGFSWPDWAADIPEAGSQFKVGMPICTVFGIAENTERAKSLVQKRAATINKAFLN